MTKLNKGIILSIIMIFTISLFTGCTGKDINGVKVNTAEEALKQFNQYNVDGNIEEMVKLYSDVYVDSVGYNRKQISRILKKNSGDVKVIKAETTKIEDVNDNVKKAIVSITSKQDDKEQITNDYIYAIVKEEGGWAVSPDGVYKCQNFNIPAPNQKELNLNLAKEIFVFDGIILRINLLNDSKKQMVFGKEGNYSKVVVDTKEGKYETTIEQIVPVDSTTQTYFLTRINGLKGDIQKVTITSIYEGDGKGNPIDGTEKDFVAYE